MTHPFQKSWFDPETEAAYLKKIEAMVHAGNLDLAASTLAGDLAKLDTPLAEYSKDVTEDRVDLAGWEEIGDAISQYEGEDPITAVHIVMSNEADQVFEDKKSITEPLVEVVFYTDEHLNFSELSTRELLEESLKDEPDWYGQSEDMEVYLEINGMGRLNTELLRHKRQYFFRDSQHFLDEKSGLAQDMVPALYVEFCLVAMLRAVRFHQAVKALMDSYGLHGKVPVIAGMHNMKIEFGAVYAPKVARKVQTVKTPKLAVTIKRNLEEEEAAEITGSSLRQNLSQEPEKKPGFFKRLFGGRKAA